MYNEDILQSILYKHGIDKAILFCEMESDKYVKTLEAQIFTDPIDAAEMQYERDWWAERAERLKNNEPC